MTVASAPGKMILLGEYAVLEGAPALVYAVNRRAQVTVKKIPGPEFQVSSPSLSVPTQPFVCTSKNKVRFDPNLEPHIRNRLIFFKLLFENLIEELCLCSTEQTLAIELVTDAFYDNSLHRKLGFGSSSAMTVALIKALIHELGLDNSESEIFDIALHVHHSAQGKVGSGIDVAASCFGGAVEYQLTKPKPSARPLNAWTDLNLAVIWTGKSASTSRMVQSVNALRTKNPDLFRERMQHLSDLSIQGIAAFKVQDISRFLHVINNFYDEMHNLGKDSDTPIISGVHQQVAQLVRNLAGAYKPSGAGGGDIGLLFAESAEKLSLIKAQIHKAGFTTIDVQLDSRGVQVENFTDNSNLERK